MSLRDRIRSVLHGRDQTLPEQTADRVVVGFDGAADADPRNLMAFRVTASGQIHSCWPLREPLLPLDLWDAALERQQIDEYQAEIRRQRFLGRMHVLQLADDAWARYSWTRPKVARR